jgi:hypothetical protein
MMSRVALRSIIKISVTPAAKSSIEKTAAETGMKEISVASRVYEWFAAQDDVVKKAMLGLLPKGYEADVAKMALERIAAGGKKRTG